MYDLFISLLNLAFWLALHFGTAGAVCALPKPVQRRLFRPNRACFQVGAREMRFYRAIRLPIWKDRLPQFNPEFNKRRLAAAPSLSYIDTFLFITCRAEIIHYAIGILGWFSLVFCLLSTERAVWLMRYACIACLIQLANLPFAWIQRYNRFRLLRLRRQILRRTSRL